MTSPLNHNQIGSVLLVFTTITALADASGARDREDRFISHQIVARKAIAVLPQPLSDMFLPRLDAYV